MKTYPAPWYQYSGLMVRKRDVFLSAGDQPKGMVHPPNVSLSTSPGFLPKHDQIPAAQLAFLCSAMSRGHSCGRASNACKSDVATSSPYQHIIPKTHALTYPSCSPDCHPSTQGNSRYIRTRTHHTIRRPQHPKHNSVGEPPPLAPEAPY